MKRVFIAVLAVIILLTAGCSQEAGPAVSIQFGELWDNDFNVSQRIKELDGKAVSMTGFMAMQSPLDGSFIYLTNAPLISCPYCIPGTNTPVFAIPAMAPPGNPIKFTEQPVTINGVLEIEEKSDEYGYTTPFRINIKKLSIADADKMSQSLREYTMLTSDGVITDTLNIIYLLANKTGDLSEVDLQDINAVDIEAIDILIRKVKGYGVTSFDPLVDILQETKDLSLEINELINNDGKERLINYNEEVLLIWNKYFDWANEMAAME